MTSEQCCIKRSRRGGTLVAVLVILAIVGMLAAHTFQTLVLLRQGDTKRATVRQSQEIIQLARHTAESEGIQSSSKTKHQLQVEVQDDKLASITIQIAEPSESDQLRDYRVVVQYPLDRKTDSPDTSPKVQPWTSSWHTQGWQNGDTPDPATDENPAIQK